MSSENFSESSPECSQISLDELGDIRESDVLSHPNMKVLSTNDQIRELQTIIRNK